MNPLPLVSIVIPVYNGSDYLAEAINSALSQTYPNIEVVVVNDGSTDGGKTETISLSYGSQIRYLRKENGGVASALNLGIQEMRGEYFAWLSHDDVFYSNKISIQIEQVKLLKDPAIVYGDYDVIDKESKVVGTRKILPSIPGDIIFDLFVKDPVNGCTTLIPRACFDRVGVFDEGLRTTQDYEMWFRLARYFSFVHVPETLIKYRRHPQQGTMAVSGHHAAEDQLYCQALTDLPPTYLENKFEEMGAAYFLKLAFHLHRRGFENAASVARTIGVQNLGRNLAKNIFGVTVFYSADLFVKYAYRSGALKNTIKKINRTLKLAK